MLALYRSGRQAEALDAYREVHRLLAGELSIEPSAPLGDLQLRMLRGAPPRYRFRGSATGPPAFGSGMTSPSCCG
ncbi:BTAD domain-containing putative transcriptional regulator [Streptomyces sp. NPDC001890]|uniref:AfsR/SARP family transcriptional regulator n=1 Tax=Streptomyces sp. NPDC001890 TaxID=3364620 RepID=UPI003685233C